MNLIKIHLARFFLLSLACGQVIAQKQCEKYPDFFLNLNKFNPQFEHPAYTTPPIRVDLVEKLNLITFMVNDKDNFNNTKFTFKTNDPNFFVDNVIGEQNLFRFNFRGKVFYNINTAHRYEILVTVSDNGVPNRKSSALFIVPLINYNVNAPQYTDPVYISAAITLQPNSFLSYLNAWDIDGDKVIFELASTNELIVSQTLAVNRFGVLSLKTNLANFQSARVEFNVSLTDDGSSCGSDGPLIQKSSNMRVILFIIEVNTHSPQFIRNSAAINYCETVFRVPENQLFTIEIVATDEDDRGQNGKITILSPEISDRSPQNSFLVKLSDQIGRTRTGTVSNKEVFDYEEPKYGSNTMNIMFYAEDQGSTKRRGYCFMTIEIEDVNDNAPVFAQSMYTLNIHDMYKSRLFTYQFVAVDRDSGKNGQVQYFMQGENEIANELFLLYTNGTLVIKNSTCIDLVKDSIEFNIYAQDMGVPSKRSSMAIVRVINNQLKILPPYFMNFPNPPIMDNVSEMVGRGYVLDDFSVVIQGDPTGQFLRCFLAPKPNPEWFKLEKKGSITGNLTKNEVCSLKVEDPLNYRVSKEMIIYMVAEVGASTSMFTARELKILTIKLKEENINSPKFVTSSIDASVVEGNSDLNKVIAMVKAYDIDITFPFNKITYEFGYGTNDGNHFSINRDTGAISLTRPIKNIKNIPLTVIAKDGANGYKKETPNQNSIYVDVKVIDINDNPPLFTQESYEFSLAENERPGFLIGTIEITDEDAETVPTYSISDSTFGIRPLNKPGANKQNFYAEIYLNNYLDYMKNSVYNLEVVVSDSQFLAKAKVIIKVTNVNNRAPEFVGLPYEVTIKEADIPNEPIVTLAAKDEDKLSNDFLFEMYPTSYLNTADYFDLNSKTGQLKLKMGLDRDLPFGRKVYNIPVSVKDMGGKSGQSLTTYTKVKITLQDINDNAPYLAYVPGFNPLQITENAENEFIEVYVIDNDEAANGPRFTFELNSYTEMFRLSGPQLCSECAGNQVKYRIVNLKRLNYDVQKSYEIAYTLRDISNNENKGILQILVKDIDNNEQQSASKNIQLLTYNSNLQPNSFLGTLYTKDKDDSDLKKTSSRCKQTPSQLPTFRTEGMSIFGPLTTSKLDPILGPFSLECSVIDSRPTNVTSRVDFNINNINTRDLQDLAGLRLFGITAKNLINKLDTSESSLFDKLAINLRGILDDANLQIVTIKDYLYINPQLSPNQIPSYDPSTQFATDVYFYATKESKYISSRKIYNSIYNSLNQLKEIIPGNYNIELLFNKCTRETQCPNANTTCKQSFLVSQHPLTIDANAVGFVGMDNKLTNECYCDVSSGDHNQKYCYNGGTFVQSDSTGLDYYCLCPNDYNGPRCEFLNIQFRFSASSPSHSYALFEKFNLCDPIRIEFEFSTDRAKGLLLFNGPINRDSKYFLAVEIVDKILVAHVGYTTIKFPNIEVSDKKWHQVEIAMSLDAIQVTLDKCYMQPATIDSNIYTEMLADKQPNDDVKLSLGGIPQSISTNHFYYKLLNVFEYEGCIRNLRVNGDLRNLKLEPSQYNLAENTVVCDCKYSLDCSGIVDAISSTKQEFPWWIILIIIAALIMLAGIMGIALCSVRRKDNLKKMLQMFPDDDIRETIINYADGAGEENTENFNIGVMKKPLASVVKPVKSNVTEMTNDQNMIYAYEGEGSDAGSLSSVDSHNIENDIDFDYLQDWGPKFQKLSHLYKSTEEITTYQAYK